MHVACASTRCLRQVLQGSCALPGTPHRAPSFISSRRNSACPPQAGRLLPTPAVATDH